MDNVGALRERIQIVVFSTTRDKYGGQQKTSSTTGLIFAKVEVKEIGTDEMFSADQKSPNEKVNFTIRLQSYTDLSYKNEIIYRDGRYKIIGIIPDAKRTYVTIESRRIQENG